MTENDPIGPAVARSPTVVLVHGAWHQPVPTWDLVRAELASRGVATDVVRLPSAAPPASTRPGLTDDIAAVVDLLDRLGEPVVLCGHSYGGMVISEAGKHRAVAGLVYLAAFCLEEGETVLSIAAVEPPPLIAAAIRYSDDGLMSIDPTRARDVFYADVDAALAARSVAALVPSTSTVFATPTPADPAWREKPSVYIVCERDQAIPVWRQREMAQRCARTVTLDASHSPFLSMPARVADVLAAEVARAASTAALAGR